MQFRLPPRGKKALNPTSFSCVVVGSGLGLFAAFYLLLKLEDPLVSDQLQVIGVWPVPVIFLLRAVGDFKYIGFFKKVRHTDFGRLDTFFIIPLCLLITALGFVVVLLK